MKSKHTKFALALITHSLVILLLVAAGCGKSNKQNTQADEGLPAEAVAVRKAFESAPPSLMHPVQETLNLVKAGTINASAYTEAIPQLQRLSSNPTISAEQKQALEALVEKLKGELSSQKPR